MIVGGHDISFKLVDRGYLGNSELPPMVTKKSIGQKFLLTILIVIIGISLVAESGEIFIFVLGAGVQNELRPPRLFFARGGQKKELGKRYFSTNVAPKKVKKDKGPKNPENLAG